MINTNFIPNGITILEASTLGFLSPVLFMQRNMGGIVADVTVEEEHVDELVITEHPVEQGASITDHSFKRPCSCTITAGWSNSSFSALGNPAYVQSVYDEFLAMQASRQPFDIVTGKRVYSNMLFKRLLVKTDEKTENALMLTAECQQIIITTTQTVTTPDPKNMKDPAADTGVSDRGSVSAMPNPGNFNGGAAPLTRVTITGGTVVY